MSETVFSRQFKRTGAQNLLRQFGELVTYHPLEGRSRVVQAMVERNESEIIAEVGDLNGQAVIVRVLNNECKGITSIEIDTGGDEIEVALRVGETRQRRSVVRLLNAQNGLTRFLVQ